MFKPPVRSILSPSYGRAVARCPAARRRLSSLPHASQSTGRRVGALTALGVVGGLAAVGYQSRNALEVHAEGPAVALLSPEEKAPKFSSQHLQVKTTVENPGVYLWGDNSGGVIDPSSSEKIVKNPRRFHFFDNLLLRDLKLCQDAGVAVTDRGDVQQWGNAYSKDVNEPELTLKGKNIQRVCLSKDKIIALSKDGTVYSVPISKKFQQEYPKLSETSWIGLSFDSPISYRILKPDLGYFETVKDIAAGQHHAILLTNKGRLFSSAASFEYPTKGQLGVRNLSWATRPAGKPFDACQEISALSGIKIEQIACGDNHSVALDKDGRVYTFGDNGVGQLGFAYDADLEGLVCDTPSVLPFKDIYPGQGIAPKVTKVAAGGSNSYFMVDVEDDKTRRTTADVLACGTGIHGNLGNGRWTHVQGVPVKIKALSGLQEFDERLNKVLPIRLKDLSVGASHSAAIMSNSTNVNATGNDVNYGNDVVWWGNNEHYQLGTGKRNNQNAPVYIPPLDPSSVALPEGELGVSATDIGFTGSSSNTYTERGSGIIGGHGDAMGSGRATRKDQVHRFQLTPSTRVKSGKKAEQKVVCGKRVTGVYMAAA